MDNVLVKQQMINNVNSAYIDKYKHNSFNIVNLEHSRNSTGGNKLRTYKLFKDSFNTESYCTMILPRSHRSAFSRFRCGVAPIRLETGRYERLPVCERVKDYVHFVMMWLKMRHMSSFRVHCITIYGYK